MSNFFWTATNLATLLDGRWSFFPDKYQWRPGYVSVKSTKRINPKFSGEKINIIRRPLEIAKAYEEISISGKKGGCIIIRDVFESRASELVKLNLPILIVPENGALKKMADYRRASFNGSVICITGTAGKTSVRGMLYRILSSEHVAVQNRDNWNFRDHVFEDLASLSNETEFLILEIGLGQKNVRIADIVDVVKPNISILTSIGVGHMDAIESTSIVENELDSVFKSKSEIFKSMDYGSFAVIPSSIAMLDEIVDVLDSSVENYELVGCDSNDSIRMLDRNWDGNVNNIVISTDASEISYSFPTPGEHMALNSLLAISAARRLGVGVNKSTVFLSDFKPKSGRASLIKTKDNFGHFITIFDDSRNSTPLSLKSSFETFDEVSKGYDRIAILGEVGDFHLGSNMEEYHRNLAKDVQALGFDKVFVMGEAMKFFMEEYPSALYFETFDGLVNHLTASFSGNSFLMLKASTHMKFRTLRDMIVRNIEG